MLSSSSTCFSTSSASSTPRPLGVAALRLPAVLLPLLLLLLFGRRPSLTLIAAQPVLWGAPQLFPTSYDGASWTAAAISAVDPQLPSSSSSSRPVFYSLSSAAALLTAVNASGRIVAISDLCTHYTSALRPFTCGALEPRPHGPLLWLQVTNSSRTIPARIDALTVAVNTTTLQTVRMVNVSTLVPAPTTALSKTVLPSGGAVCTDSLNRAYVLGFGEVWVLSATGEQQVGYFVVPGVNISSGAALNVLGAFDKNDTLWLVTQTNTSGTAVSTSFQAWRLTTTGQLVNTGTLTIPVKRLRGSQRSLSTPPASHTCP